ncbi:Rho termination factor N-terminal domain-containing protein [Sporolactobacillus shoreicorticis]|uniref:Rho termination factor N-terminal domain-containing protein n=2 Tax=Sporolactobacillus shoreicorticis TaxID=1923877 RepID=A0ABW5S1V1_9BACL|nr:Rho termination factor N-terminal domain-containing protein [Sporolactobacillus shoreicorticis]MCO7125111.1 Rho termination factor N-terminal domain-containing protein [Sporolactobacillus shoreicorticis]
MGFQRRRRELVKKRKSELEALNLNQLRALAKERGIKDIVHMNKAQLVAELGDH